MTPCRHEMWGNHVKSPSSLFNQKLRLVILGALRTFGWPSFYLSSRTGKKPRLLFLTNVAHRSWLPLFLRRRQHPMRQHRSNHFPANGSIFVSVFISSTIMLQRLKGHRNPMRSARKRERKKRQSGSRNHLAQKLHKRTLGPVHIGTQKERKVNDYFVHVFSCFYNAGGQDSLFSRPCLWLQKAIEKF